MPNSYYSLDLQTSGAARHATYFYVTVVGSESTFDGAGMTISPSVAQTTWFSYQSQSVQFQAPAARISGGITVVTPNQEVAGTIGVSPAIDVDTVLSIYGDGGMLGSVTLSAGKTSTPFHFDVGGSAGMSLENAQNRISSRPA
jgi:hypothetical protein